MHGGGGLHSTAGDYLTFLRAGISDDGSGVFGPQTRRWLREAQVPAGSAGELVTAAPPLSADFRPMPGTPKAWTLGFLRNETDVPKGRRAGSLAWGGLANCYYWADPESGLAGVLFGQLLPFADPGMLAVFEAFERAVYES
jgi:CubicO group peptidase (beta-lactamase class C family)